MYLKRKLSGPGLRRFLDVQEHGGIETVSGVRLFGNDCQQTNGHLES